MRTCGGGNDTKETLAVMVAFCKALRLAMDTNGIDWTIGLLRAALDALEGSGRTSSPGGH